MSEKKDRKTQNLCFDALTTLFKSKDLVSENFSLAHIPVQNQELVKRYYTTEIKYSYERFMENLTKGLNDELEFF